MNGLFRLRSNISSGCPNTEPEHQTDQTASSNSPVLKFGTLPGADLRDESGAINPAALETPSPELVHDLKYVSPGICR